ncbi:MAG: hypothetical protein CMO81_02805 [Waddliaceae bacterium]|nr:hypothetical protein [Waddliaceae bacterium]
MKNILVRFVLKSILISAIAMSTAGCACVFKGDSRTVSLNSNPSGAEVLVNGAVRGATPMKLNLEAKKNHTIEFRKQGYQTQSVSLDKRISVGWVIADAIFGLVPVVVDAATGSWYEFDSKDVTASLESIQAEAIES